MDFKWSYCYPAETACPSCCALLSCDEIYGWMGELDSVPMYNVIRTIDACKLCDNTKCTGWNNLTRTGTSEASSSVKYAVQNCDQASCGRVYVDACSGFARSTILSAIIAFMVTTLLGYVFIQYYFSCKRRREAHVPTPAWDTEIQCIDEDSDPRVVSGAPCDEKESKDATVVENAVV